MQLIADHVNDIVVLAVFAVSFNLLAGYSGQVSVAHAAFGAIGGYTVARLFLAGHHQLLVGAAIGSALAAVVGLVIGAAVLRLTSEWLMLMTFAVQVVVVSLATTAPALGGTYGLQGISGLRLFGYRLDEPTHVLPVFLAAGLAIYGVCHRIGESPYGRVLRGIREDESAARSLGKRTPVHKLTVFAVTAAMAGLGGVMLVVQNTVASPASFDLALATVIVSAVVIGGNGNLLGSVLAAALIVLSTPFLEDVVKLDATTASLWQLVIYGTALIAVLFFRPVGLLPEGFSLHRRERVAAGAAAPPVRPSVPTARAPAANSNGRHGDAILEVRGLCKRFGGIVAADRLDLTLQRGSISALVGPNGAGKTTLFNLLTGAIAPDAGAVVLEGRDVVGMSPDRIARLGMVRSFQDVRVFPRLTALENVLLGVPDHPGERLVPLMTRPRHVARHEREAVERAREWLDFVGLAALADARMHDLGFGEQKLVAFARVLATEAELLLLDEPASGVDAQWIEPLVELIQRSRSQGRTVCIVEHNLEVVERLADDVAFMELGRITARGSFRELTSETRLAEAYFGS